MHSIVVLLGAAAVCFVTANPLGTKTILESIIPTPLVPSISASALTQPLPFSSINSTSSLHSSETAEPTSGQSADDPAAGNLAAAIAVAFSSPGPIFNLSVSAVASATTFLPTTTKPLSITAISDTVIAPLPPSSPSSSVYMATVPLGSVLSTTVPFATGLSAIVPMTSYPSQEPTLPIPRLPEPPEASLSALINNASTGYNSSLITVPSRILTLPLPTGVSAGKMTTLPAIVLSAVPTASSIIDPGALLKNVTAAMELLEVLVTVLEGDSGDVSAVLIPGVGTSIGGNDELAELLRGMAVSLLI